jgi:hypothetical protein
VQIRDGSARSRAGDVGIEVVNFRLRDGSAFSSQ